MPRCGFWRRIIHSCSPQTELRRRILSDGCRNADFIFPTSGILPDTDPLVQRSKRKATRWWPAGCEVRQRFLYLHQLFLVSAVAGRRSRGLSVVREHVVTRKMKTSDDKSDSQSWPKAYSLALSLFAVEVVLLYLFTLRFS